MCLGGGQWQLDLIRTVRLRGYHVLVADRSPLCPGRANADTFAEVDTSDVEAVLAVATEHRPRFVLAEQTDRVVPVAAKLNERLNLPGIRPDVAMRFTDKLVMRQSLEGHNIFMPAYRPVTRFDDAAAFAAEIGYPVIVKPRRAQSSIGVFKSNDANELRDSFPRSMAHSGALGSLLVERFVEGLEITVEGICLNGLHSVLAVSEKEHYDFNPCVARRLAYPPRFEPSVLAEIREVTDKIVKVLGLVDGLTHAEFRMHQNRPYLVEIAARGGGTRIAPLIVPWVSGISVYDLLLDRLEGASVNTPTPLQRSAALEFFSFPSGRVKAIRGVKAASKSVADIRLAFAPGDLLSRPEDDTSRVGHFIVFGEDRDTVDKSCATIRELVSVEYE